MVDLELEVVDRDFSIRVDGSLDSEAEDIFYGLIRGFDLESSEERPFFFEGFLEPQIRDFLSSGMDLLVIISVEFMVKNPLSLFNFGDILSDTGSNESILEPTIGSFHFPLGLRRKGIGDFDITILQDLFPLRGRFIGEQVVFSPEGVPSLDESKDAMGVHIVGVRKSMVEDHGLEGQDMGPAGLLVNQSGIQEESAIVVQRSDEVPFLLRSGGPEMIRGIMLDQFSNIVG